MSSYFIFLQGSSKFIRTKTRLLLILLGVFVNLWTNAQSLISMENGVVTYGYIYATQFDSLNGKLYIGGSFKSISGVTVANVAVWNGSVWNTLGTGIAGTVLSMKLVGSELYVGGYIQAAGGTAVQNMAKWDGTSWSGVDSGSGEIVTSIEYFQNKIYTAGYYPYQSIYHLSSYDGFNWTHGIGSFDKTVTGMLVADSGLVIYGAFTRVNANQDSSIVKYDGSQFIRYPLLGQNGITSMTVVQDSMYALYSDSIAHWNGHAWTTDYVAGSSPEQPMKIFSYQNNLCMLTDSGFNPEYVIMRRLIGGVPGGQVMRMRWITNYSPAINSIISHGNSLFIAGRFDRLQDTLAPCLLHYNGSVWTNPGKPAGEGYYDAWNYCDVNTMVKDSSTGDIYAGGRFFFAGDLYSPNVARWDGTSWHALDRGLTSTVYKLIYYNNQLFAIGNFARAGSTLVNGIARWNGSSWVPVISGTNGSLYDAVVYHGELYVSGSFTILNGVSANYVAKFNGTSWAAVGNNVLDYNSSQFSIYHDTLIVSSGSYYYFQFPNHSYRAYLDGSNTWQYWDVNSTVQAADLLVFNGELYAAEAVTWDAYHVYKWINHSWTSIASLGDGMDGISLLNFRGSLAATISNDGFYLFDGAAFNRVADIQPYAVLQDGNDTYLGGFMHAVTIGSRLVIINHIGKLDMTLPQVNATCLTDTLCEHQYAFFDLQTQDVFAKFHWHMDGGNPDTISDAAPVVQYINPGTHHPYVVVTNLVGSDTIMISPPVVVLPCLTAVNEPSSTSEFNLYPNPARDMISLPMDEKFIKIILYDLYGKMVREFAYHGDNHLDLTGIPAGIYLLTILRAESAKSYKIVKL